MPALRGGMILYSRRSAKSVACSRLNVIGVSAFFFLPLFVAALTSADEFHSVTNTRCPSAVSHFASSPSCVVFPDPSMPSTTNSLPGYSCRFSRLFNIGLSAHFHAQRLADQPLEGRRLARGRPNLELRIAVGLKQEQRVFAPIMEFEARDCLRVASIEPLCQAKHGRERSDHLPQLARQLAVAVVVTRGRGAAMIPRHEGEGLDLLGVEPPEVSVLDEIVRVSVMALVADVDADVVEEGSVFEQLALLVR